MKLPRYLFDPGTVYQRLEKFLYIEVDEFEHYPKDDQKALIEAIIAIVQEGDKT